VYFVKRLANVIWEGGGSPDGKAKMGTEERRMRENYEKKGMIDLATDHFDTAVRLSADSRGFRKILLEL
jgi:hypothetical protein